MNKNAFEVWSTMLFMKGSDKRKYGEFVHDFSIQYEMKNYQYPKTMQEALNIVHKAKLKTENNND